MIQSKEYDFIIYGANGVTARRVVHALSSYDVKVALSSRDITKIDYNPKNYPLLQSNIESIDTITSKTKILMNCAGPYILTGEQIVGSCVRNNTHYMDITGETEFIRKMVEKFDDVCKMKNVFVWHCVGFDSLPCDVAFDMVKRKMLDACRKIDRKIDGDKLNEQIESQSEQVIEDDQMVKNKIWVDTENMEIWNFLKAKKFKINYTTWQSLIFGLNTHFKKPKKQRSLKERKLPSKFFFSKERNAHCAIFMGTDHSVVTRSQKLYKELQNEPIIRFFIYLELGGLLNKFLFMFFFSMIMVLVKFEFGKKLLLKYPSFFTFGIVKKGISDDEIKDSCFEMNLYGYFDKNQKDFKNKEKCVQLTVKGPDPGYKTTPLCMVESGMILLEKINKKEKICDFSGGVVTPAMVLRDSDIVERLGRKGLSFEFV